MEKRTQVFRGTVQILEFRGTLIFGRANLNFPYPKILPRQPKFDKIKLFSRFFW